MVKAVHPLVKAIYPLVEAAHPLVVGKNTERIVNTAGESTERTHISAHWAESEVVGVNVRGWCRSSVIIVTDVTPLSDPLLRFQTRPHLHLSLHLPFFSSRTRRPITQRRAGIKGRGFPPLTKPVLY